VSIPTYIESIFTAFNEQLAILQFAATTAQV
jgi:energy-converting hydrogenase Eha subunit E